MAPRGFHSILTECLDQMNGGASLEHVVARHPKHAEKLRPILSLAEKVRKTPIVTARPGAQERAWNQVRSRAEELRTGRRFMPMPVPRLSLGFRAWMKPVAFAGALALFFSASSGAVVYASQDALPDSPLYSVKLASEDVHLWFVFDEKHEANILLDQSTERMQEIVTVVGRGDAVPGNALSAMHDRNQRAAAILQKHPAETSLRARVLTQAQSQEERLVALWPQVPEDTRQEYATAVAHLHNSRLDGGSGSTFVSVRPEELIGGILNISGPAEEVETGVWQIGGLKVEIDDRTIGRQGLQSGVSGTFVVARGSNGRLRALSLFNIQNGTATPTGSYVSGEVEEVSDAGITVAGNFIPFDATTLPTSPVKVGERVQVAINSTTTGIAAGAVQTATPAVTSFTFEGTIEGDVSDSTSRWTIGGRQFKITDSTGFDLRAGKAADGARVQVDALNREGELEALRVTVLASLDAASTASIIGTFDGFDETALVWRVSGLEILPPDPVPNDPPIGSLVSIDLKLQGIDLETTGISVVEAPDDPSLVRIQGTINAIDNTRWSLEFGQVRVGSIARVQGKPDVGMRVIVWGERAPDGSLQARHVRTLDDLPVLTPTPSPAAATPTPPGEG